MNERQEAIFFPLISRKTAGYITLALAILIAVGILFFPSHKEIPLTNWMIPDALVMGNNSKFPFALTVTYSFAVYASLACGLLTGFAKGDLEGLSKIWGGHRVTFRVLANLLMALYIYLLITQEFIPSSKYQISNSFFSLVANNRLVACVWLEGIFGFTYCAALVFLYDISRTFKRIVCK